MTEPVVLENISDVRRLFGWEDYTVFAAMLVGSALIGVYHGFQFGGNSRKKKDEVEDSSGEFLTAGGKMATLPVALSMLAR